MAMEGKSLNALVSIHVSMSLMGCAAAMVTTVEAAGTLGEDGLFLERAYTNTVAPSDRADTS